MPLLIKGISKKERDKKGRELLKNFGLIKIADKFPNQLSGGEKQRVSIMRALINEPLLILADEPTGNLDSYNGAIVIEQLRQLVDKGNTVLLVTHNIEDAKKCDRIIELFDGKVVNKEGKNEIR